MWRWEYLADWQTQDDPAREDVDFKMYTTLTDILDGIVPLEGGLQVGKVLLWHRDGNEGEDWA